MKRMVVLSPEFSSIWILITEKSFIDHHWNGFEHILHGLVLTGTSSTSGWFYFQTPGFEIRIVQRCSCIQSIMMRLICWNILFDFCWDLIFLLTILLHILYPCSESSGIDKADYTPSVLAFLLNQNFPFELIFSCKYAQVFFCTKSLLIEFVFVAAAKSVLNLVISDRIVYSRDTAPAGSKPQSSYMLSV